MTVALKTHDKDENPQDLWDMRYDQDGNIWGDQPSLTAKFAAISTNSGGKIFEVGFGYGRDIVFLAKRGYDISGIEKSAVGLRLATKAVAGVDNKKVSLLSGDFLQAALPENHFDAVIAHRVIHLLEDDEQIKAFAKQAYKTLKPNGFLFVTARDDRDFNPEQMVDIGNGIAAYKTRPGHHIRFWNQAAFKKFFGEDFRIVSCKQTIEIESVKNPVPAHLTTCMALKLA